jgi:hypothetical protein
MADPKKNPAPAAPAAPAAPKDRNYEVKLTAPGKELKCIAKEKAGKFVSHVFIAFKGPDGKKTGEPSQRGATTQHPSFDKAKAAADAAADAAVAKGWTKKARGAFGGGRADSFTLDSIPVAK